MPVWVRRLAIGFGLALSLLIAAGVWLVATFDAERYKALAIDWVAARYERRLAIDGPVRLSVFPRLALRVAGVRLSEPGSDREFAAIDEASFAAEVLPLLRNRLVVDHVSAHGVRLAWRRDADGRSNVDDLLRPSSSPPATGAGSDGRSMAPQISGLVLSDVRVRVRDDAAGIDGEVRLDALNSGRLADGIEAPLRWTLQLALAAPALKGELSGSARLTPNFETGSVRLGEADLVYQGDALGRGGIDLRLQGALNWNGATRAFDAPAIALQVDMPADGSSGRPLTLHTQGRMDGSARQLRWKLDGRIGADPFSLEGDAAFGAPAPVLNLQARFEVLDLDRWRAGATPAPAAGTSTPASAKDTPLDMAALRRVDGRFDIHAGRLVREPYRVDALHFAGTLRAGLLNLPTLQGQTWGGDFDASASADARTQRLALKGTASGIDAQAMLRDLTERDTLQGKGRVTVDLAGGGSSVAELKSHLAGSASLQLRDGAIQGVNLAKVLRQARAALTQRQDRMQQASQTEKTDFSELSASFRVSEGVARSSDLQAKSPFLRLAGDGLVDIGRGRIDYTVRASVTDTAQGQEGAELAALKGVTVPVRLAGPLDAIEWQVQWSALASNALKDRLEDKLREKLGIRPPADAAPGASPKDQLKDRLRGLFR